MAQATSSIRLDEDVKNEMDAVCESIGVSMSTAFNVFARAFVRSRGFPFDVKLQEKEDPWEGFLNARRRLREKYPEGLNIDGLMKKLKQSGLQNRNDLKFKRKMLFLLLGKLYHNTIIADFSGNNCIIIQ